MKVLTPENTKKSGLHSAGETRLATGPVLALNYRSRTAKTALSQ